MKILKLSDEKYIINGEYALKLALSDSDHSRDVYVSENYCLKVSVFSDYQNKNEWSIWKSLDTKDRKYFAEILFCEKDFLVQRRYFNNKFARNDFVWNILINLCNKYEIDDVVEEDRNYFMIRKNHPLIVDYGTKS
jgi:hypothetical protein